MSIKLDAKDLRNLISVLLPIPQLSTERNRRQILELSGLHHIIPHIDISGQAFVAITSIITYLAQYGPVSYEQEALGVFLNTLIEMDMVRGKEQETVIFLLDKYQMMLPVATSDMKIDAADGILDISLEKIIGEDTLRPIAFLSEGIKAGRAVCHIVVRVPGQRSHTGTGFLISPHLVLTNHHVLKNLEAAKEAAFRFNFEETALGASVEITEYRYRKDGIFHVNSDLDYAVVQLSEPAGDNWGYLPLEKNIPAPKSGMRVNIIQHPAGRPKHVSLQNNFVEYAGPKYLQYVTATQPGSSGSPVMNNDWKVIALHHAGGNIREPTTNRIYFRNQGVQITAILNDLPDNILKKITE